MDHDTGSYLARGGVTIFTQTWAPADTPKALVLIVHGFGEHSGRYTHVAEALVAAGYAVASYDQRGHGRSGGPRGLLRDLSVPVADLALYREELARGPFGDLPTVLLGHSMGGAITLEHLIGDHAPVEAVVLSAPYVRNAAKVSPVLKVLAPIIARFLPSVPTEAIDPAAVSRDPEVVKAYAEDPLVFHGKLPAASGAVALAMESRLMPQAGKVTEPSFIIHGTEDQLADVEGSRVLAGRMGGPTGIKTYDGLFHEVFNEPEGKDVIADVIGWIDAELAA